MLDFARDIIGTQPILTAFLAIGLGYLVGQINIFGFSLGVGAVLFVGLALGAFAPKAQIVGPIGLIGLIMFLYGVGILYGRQFFEGMTGVAGRKYNLLAFVAVMAGLAVALGLGHVFGIKLGHTLGLFAGSMTSTATLQAALDTMRNSEPSIGYSVSYPFGVIGPILCIYFMTRTVRPKFPPKEPQLHMAEITLGADCSGWTLDDLRQKIPSGVQIEMVRKGGRNFLPTTDVSLDAGDALLVIAERQSDIGDAAARVGKLEPGRVVKDRSALDYIRVFVGKANLVGVPLAKLPLPTGFPVQLLHVRRYDVDIVPSPDLALEFGDRVGILMPPDRKDEVRKYFGDTVKSTAEFSYVSLGVGMVLGVLLGLIPIPIPGVGTVTLGIGGGPLIVALIVGKLRRTGPLLWVMPLPANIVLRNFGLGLVPGDGRRQCRPAVLEDRIANRADALADRRAGSPCDRPHRAPGRLLPVENSVRRFGRGRVRRHRQSGHPGLLEPDGPDRAARHWLCYDLSFNDDRQSRCRANRRAIAGNRCGLIRPRKEQPCRTRQKAT